MKMREFSCTGKITEKGQLSMYMGELNAFFSKHKGKRVIAKFYVAPMGTSEALKGYYFHVVVPSFRQALYETGVRKTDEQTEIWLREISPVTYESIIDISTGKYSNRIKEISELDNAELVEHIEHLKQIAAEEFNLYIEEPNAL